MATKIKEEIVKEGLDASKSESIEANKLITLKKKTDMQLEQMRILKNKIKPSVINDPIRTRSGVVSFVQGGSSKFLNRDKVKMVLMSKLHISPETADIIINAGSTDKIISSYVKVTPA